MGKTINPNNLVDFDPSFSQPLLLETARPPITEYFLDFRQVISCQPKSWKGVDQEMVEALSVQRRYR
jgi:hypothetical protein